MTRPLIGAPRQLGMIVRDLDEAIDHCAKVLGIGPFVVLPVQQFVDYTYRGKETTGPVCTLAFAETPTVQVELIVQHDDVPSAYTEFLDGGGDGVQHICYWPDSGEEFDAWREDLLGSGLSVVHEGRTEGSPLRFCYLERPGASRYPMIELSEGNLPVLRPAWARLRDANAEWDGAMRTVPIDLIFG